MTAMRELAEFLKTRRARLAPEDVGLVPGRGRRSPGLRREDVAAIAGVGLSWYTRLEQGKPISVSTAFLENLARALRLTGAERAHLFVLAQHRLPPLPSGSAEPVDVARLQTTLDAVASPALARNSRFDVLAWNAANTRIFGDFASVAAESRNIVRLFFLRASRRKTLPHWESDARNLLAKFRINLGQAADPAPFHALVAELEAISADFRRLWAEHHVVDPGEGVTHFRSPRDGNMVFQHRTLMPEGLPDIRIMIYVPVAA